MNLNKNRNIMRGIFILVVVIVTWVGWVTRPMPLVQDDPKLAQKQSALIKLHKKMGILTPYKSK